ncbi:hypothetical protein HZU77_012655 [Neisseriaceae bacterium TC5R-5]|nr:hypothetical protein [Neisseriaceae bacterium TC5R-5]
MMSFDLVVLTDARWLVLDQADWYSRQVHQEDGLVVAALEQEGLTVVRKAWDDPALDCSQMRSALFRSTWDYFDRFAEFSRWLNRVTKQLRLFNGAELIRWNIDKHYLADLAASGINVVATRYLHLNQPQTLAQLLAEQGWDEVVLKPVVSGAARHTYRLRAQDASAHECLYAELIQLQPMMLQALQQEILTAGELSLIVIDGVFSHAVRKTAKAGDFRVQDDHGGQVHAYTPSQLEISFAEAAVAAVPFEVLYARVDMLRDNQGQLAIMELEMIEPELFFRFCPSAAQVLAKALARALR